MDTITVSVDPLVLSFAVAMGIGLLVGVERERRKGNGPSRAVAGIRTFALAAIGGAVAMAAGGVALLAVLLAGTGALVAVAYWMQRSEDPGLTTEVALCVTVLLGGFSVVNPTLAGASGVQVAILLAARSWLHRFATSVLTETEIGDALILAGATFVILPLLPDQALDGFGVVNPRSIWVLVLLVMSIGALGHVFVRALGTRFGLPLSGFASGFVSSTAAIGAMGARLRRAPDDLLAATAAASLSTVATVIQLAVVLSATNPALALRLAPSLVLAALAAIAYGGVFTVLAMRKPTADAEPRIGSAFSVGTAIVFAATLTVILVFSALSAERLGSSGLLVATALAGFADVHSAAMAAALLAARGEADPSAAVLPVLAALATNTISKSVAAFVGGGTRFAARLMPGLALVVVAAWLGLAVGVG